MVRVERVVELVGCGRMRGAEGLWCGLGLVFFCCEESKLWQEVVEDGAEGSTEVGYTGLERHRLLCHFQAEWSTGVGTIQ